MTPKRILCLLAAPALLLAPVRGGPVESAIVAAMKLPDAPSYRWRTEVTDDARSYEISGSTERAGDFSMVTMPRSSAGPRRGPRGAANAGNTTVTAWYKGAVSHLVQVGEEWRRPDDFGSGENRDIGRGRRGGGFGGPGIGGPGMGGPGMGGRGWGGRGGGGFPEEDRAESGRAYSNLQTSLSRPHEEIAIIVAGATDLKAEGDVISGALPETAARLLLVHEGQKDRKPLQASGTFRMWVREGNLVRYEVRLEGRLAVDDALGRREVDVKQTALTTLSEVGTAKVEVPADVRRKLGS